MKSNTDIGLLAQAYGRAANYLRADYAKTRERQQKIFRDIEDIVSKTTYTYRHNRVVNINANILVTNIPGFAVAALASFTLEHLGVSKEHIAIPTAIAEFVAYNSIFLYMHHLANGHKFTDPKTGKLRKMTFAKDAGKVLLPAIPTTIIFYAIAPWAHRKLMMTGSISPAVASQAAYWGASFVAQGAYNLIAWKTGAFKQPMESSKPAGEI